MCPADDSHLTLEFQDHYVIKPTIQFAHNTNYETNKLGEVSKPVAPSFEYNSGNNPHFLNPEEINDFNAKAQNDIRIRVGLKPQAMVDIQRVSKPGLRIYKGYNDMPRVISGLGVSVVSTSAGIISSRKAKKLKLTDYEIFQTLGTGKK